MKTLIGIQDEFIQTIVAASSRWGHRKCDWNSLGVGGHFNRIRRGARTKAIKSLKTIGFEGDAAERIIADAMDMAKLEINAE